MARRKGGICPFDPCLNMFSCGECRLLYKEGSPRGHLVREVRLVFFVCDSLLPVYNPDMYCILEGQVFRVYTFGCTVDHFLLCNQTFDAYQTLCIFFLDLQEV